MEMLAASFDRVSRRRDDRHAVTLTTTALIRDGEMARVPVVNLSRHGCMFVTDAALIERAPVQLEIPALGWRHARVVWRRGKRVGAQFAAPLPLAAFRRLLAHFGND